MELLRVKLLRWVWMLATLLLAVREEFLAFKKKRDGDLTEMICRQHMATIYYLCFFTLALF